MAETCSQCGKAGPLSVCSSCKVVRYCGRECQALHHTSHKTDCKKVKKLIDNTAKAERALRAEFQADNGIDVFEEEAGNFWGWHETRPYMRSRYSHFLLLSEQGLYNKYALQEAVVQGRDMLRLCRGDNLGIRDNMISLYLLLNTYKGMQSCYDFAKWWDTGDPNGTYDWGDNTLPYLNLSGENMLEAPYPELLKKFASINNVAGIAVIKMRLMLQLDEFLSSLDQLFLSTLPDESFVHRFRGNEGVLGTVAGFLRPSYPCFSDKSVAELRALRVALHEQVQQLMRAAEALNGRIWKALVNPAKVLEAGPPGGYSAGSAEEAILVVTRFLPLFSKETADGRALRKVLVERVGEKPTYDLSARRY